MMLPKTTWLQPLIQLNHVYICCKNVPLHKSFGFMLLIGIHSGWSCMFSFLEDKWIDLWSLLLTLWSSWRSMQSRLDSTLWKWLAGSWRILSWFVNNLLVFIFYFYLLFFLRCNCVVLAIPSVATCKRERGDHCFDPLFSFPIVYHDIKWIKFTIVYSKKNFLVTITST